MAVDIIARALAAKASQGGSGGGKVPIDISYAMEEVDPVIRDSYSQINQMIVLLPEDLAEYIGSKIAAAGKDNVSLFFKQFGQEHHQAFSFEQLGYYYYCFLLDSGQGLSLKVEEGSDLPTTSLIHVVYNIKTETIEGVMVWFISTDETPLYVTGAASKTFIDLASVKTILTYDKNQVIETKDHVFKNYINELLQGVMSISSTEGDLVSRIEHYKNGVTPLYWGEYSKVSKQWAFVSPISNNTTSIIEDLKIYNGTLDVNSWAETSIFKDKVSIVFSNGVPSRLVFNLTEEITLAANTPLYKYSVVDTTIPGVQTLWGNVALAAAVAPNIITTNFISHAGNWTKSYYCSSELTGDQLGLRFFSKENVTIPAKSQIVIKLS